LLKQPIPRAIFYQFLTVLLFVTMNFAVKYISEDVNSVESLFFRNALSLVVICLYIFLTKKYELFKTKKPMMHFKRSFSGNLGVLFVYMAYAMLPMADMTALLSATPVVASLFAFFMIGEKPRSLSWGFIFSGVLGVLIIAQPSGDVTLEGILAAFAAISMFAWVAVQLREMGRSENSVTTVFYFCLVGALFSSPALLFMETLPTMESVLFLGLIGFCGLTSQLFKTESLKFIPVSIATPITHVGLVLAAIYGYVFWDDIPESHVMIGATIIIISTICLVKYKERKVSNV